MIPRERKSRNIASRLALLVGALATLAYVAGLWMFVSSLQERPSEAKSADAIVALTGGGARVATAFQLLADGRAKRLLISGVHEDVTRDQLFEQVGGARAVFDCCVDMGHGADSTAGNADEAARWVRANGYRSIILVTAAYHMPRSELEFAAAMPDVKIIEQSVFPEKLQTEAWWRDPFSSWVLVGEYTKYLMASARLSLVEPLGLHHQDTSTGTIDYGRAAPGQEPENMSEAAPRPGT